MLDTAIHVYTFEVFLCGSVTVRLLVLKNGQTCLFMPNNNTRKAEQEEL